MVGRSTLVAILACLHLANASMPLATGNVHLASLETSVEQEYWESKARALRLEYGAEPWSWSTSTRGLGLNDKATWRTSLGADISHPRVNGAIRKEGDSHLEALHWNRLTLLLRRNNEEQLARFDIASTRELIKAHRDTLDMTSIVEKSIRSAIHEGAATRGDVLEASEVRLESTQELAILEAHWQGLVQNYKFQFGREPGSAPQPDAALLDMQDSSILQLALATDPDLHAQECTAKAMSAKTKGASVPAWTWPAKVEAIVDWDDKNGNEETYGFQLTFNITPKEKKHLAAAEESAHRASIRLAEQNLKQMVLAKMAETRSARSAFESAQAGLADWENLVAEANEAAVNDPALSKRRDKIALRLARSRIKTLELQNAYQRLLLELTQWTGRNDASGQKASAP